MAKFYFSVLAVFGIMYVVFFTAATIFSNTHPLPLPPENPVITTPLPKPKPTLKPKTRYVRAAPPLGYSCATIRWAVRTFPRSWIEAEARKRNITPAQRRYAARCLREH